MALHSSGVPRSKDCNLVNETTCLATTKPIIVVVVGWKKSPVLSIHIRDPQQRWLGV